MPENIEYRESDRGKPPTEDRGTQIAGSLKRNAQEEWDVGGGGDLDLERLVHHDASALFKSLCTCLLKCT